MDPEGHWSPVSEWCNFCYHKFDYIIKLESEPWELWYLVDSVGLWKDRAEFLKCLNSANSKNTDKPNNKEEDIKYFVSNLSNDQKVFINKLYENDFLMLNYDKMHIQSDPAIVL